MCVIAKSNRLQWDKIFVFLEPSVLNPFSIDKCERLLKYVYKILRYTYMNSKVIITFCHVWWYLVDPCTVSNSVIITHIQNDYPNTGKDDWTAIPISLAEFTEGFDQWSAEVLLWHGSGVWWHHNAISGSAAQRFSALVPWWNPEGNGSQKGFSHTKFFNTGLNLSRTTFGLVRIIASPDIFPFLGLSCFAFALVGTAIAGLGLLLNGAG